MHGDGRSGECEDSCGADARGDENPGGEGNTSVIDMHDMHNKGVIDIHQHQKQKEKIVVPGESAPTALAALPPRLHATLHRRAAARHGAACLARTPPCTCAAHLPHRHNLTPRPLPSLRYCRRCGGNPRRDWRKEGEGTCDRCISS